jgi:NAD(P)H-quinone oxidoreductase subunit 5
VGHSLYKAHAFLSASTVVRQTRLKQMRGARQPTTLSLWLAPVTAVATVLLIQTAVDPAAWPWWWSAVLGLAWAPLLWRAAATRPAGRGLVRDALSGLLMMAGLTAAALLAHALPWGLQDAPHHTLGAVALAGMGALYLSLVLLQTRPQSLEAWRRWSYAGYYADEHTTRLTLWLWPTRWTPAPVSAHAATTPGALPSAIATPAR